MAGVHDDLTDGNASVVDEVDFVSIGHDPARPDQLLVNEDPGPFFWRHVDPSLGLHGNTIE